MAIKFTNTPIRPLEPKAGKGKGSKKTDGKSNPENSELDNGSEGK